jgi:hypothetical protein
MESAARSLGEHVRILNASTARDIETAFEDIARAKIKAILIGTDPALQCRAQVDFGAG